MTSPSCWTRIVLIGPMGAGKTTIGRMVANELGFEFRDSDRVIEQRCGAGIPWIFDVEGEAGFRLREHQVIDELTALESIVLATGGGAILDPQNRQAFCREGSLVVYLKTSVDQQFQRTRRDKNRPLLQKENPRDILQQLFDVRDPLYQSVAAIVVATDRKTPKSVVRQIIKKFHEAPVARVPVEENVVLGGNSISE